MNYLKVYCNLIRKAENRTPPEGYTEKHHTFPKSIFGKNNRIVVLTSREHYIAHCLLERIYVKRYGINDVKSQKMLFSHLAMKSYERYFNSRLYESCRVKYSNSIKGSNHWYYGKSLTEEHKEKIGLKVRGKNNPRYGKPGCVGEKNGMFGVPQSGELNPMYGKKQSEETKNLISQKAKERYKNGFVSPTLDKKLSEERVLAMSKEFCVVSPDGEVVTGINQSEFCRKNNLDQGSFNRMLNGKGNICKGWTVSEPSSESPQDLQVLYDEPVNQTPLMTSHEALEALAEEAEDFLNDRDIELTSHSYENIITQAQKHGFKV